MTPTVTIQAGNTDGKLTATEWRDFTDKIASIAANFGQVHFAGHSPQDAAWENFCVVVCIDLTRLLHLRRELMTLRAEYRQDSVAFTPGETFFV